MTKKARYYGVSAGHSILKMPGMGPFPTAAEAGATLDQLQALYPAALLRIYELSAQAITAVPGQSIDEKIEHARYCLALACGQVEPYSVIEALETHDQLISMDYARSLAERVGCPSDEIGLIQGESRWVVVRRHLDTFDYAKAETKALWLRRGRGKVGDYDELGEICVVTLPIYAPTEDGLSRPK